MFSQTMPSNIRFLELSPAREGFSCTDSSTMNAMCLGWTGNKRFTSHPYDTTADN